MPIKDAASQPRAPMQPGGALTYSKGQWLQNGQPAPMFRPHPMPPQPALGAPMQDIGPQPPVPPMGQNAGPGGGIAALAQMMQQRQQGGGGFNPSLPTQSGALNTALPQASPQAQQFSKAFLGQ